jgi:hydroxymethylglutaryl-CoA synthase
MNTSRCSSFRANALTKLIIEHDIKPEDIARIMWDKQRDSSKPIASFLLALMEEKFGKLLGSM